MVTLNSKSDLPLVAYQSMNLVPYLKVDSKLFVWTTFAKYCMNFYNILYMLYFPAALEDNFCPMVFDSFLCWPRTKAGDKVWQKCPDGVRGLDGESK